MKLFTVVFLILLTSVFEVSYAGGKHKFLDTGNTHSSMKKTRGFVHLNIVEVRRDENYIYLKAEISPQRDMPSSQLKWQLPEGVKIAEGSEEEISHLKAHKTVFSDIVIEKESLKDNSQIFFFAYHLANGERYGSSSSYVFKETANGEFKASGKVDTKVRGKKIIQ